METAKPRKIDQQWEAIDAQYHLIEQLDAKPYAIITIKDIHKMRQIRPDIKFEPRLLSHFDNKSQQPHLFNDNHLSLLPCEGGYVIGHFNTFIQVRPEPEEIEVQLLPHGMPPLETLQPDNLMNEAMGINYAEFNGFIKNFIGENKLFATVSGRHRGGNWDYQIRSNNELMTLSSGNPQIEIDGGYEGEHSIVLIEAKNKLVSEFCLRQLYFPMRAWSLRATKPIRTVFAAISGTDIYFYEYEFKDPSVFEATCSKSMHYIASTDFITQNEILDCFHQARPTENTAATFPQANSPERALDVIIRIASSESGLDKFAISEIYGLHERQGDYYANTAVYLGFAQRERNNGGRFIATNIGRKNANMDTRARKLDFVRAIFARPVFYETYNLYLSTNKVPSSKEITPIVAKYRADLTKETPERRASTVRKWILWVVSLTGK